MTGLRGFDISAHAAERWLERVGGKTPADARAAIRRHAVAIETALGMGCKCVRLGTGQRLILDHVLREVVTVLPTPPKSNKIGVAKRATAQRERSE